MAVFLVISSDENKGDTIRRETEIVNTETEQQAETNIDTVETETKSEEEPATVESEEPEVDVEEVGIRNESLEGRGRADDGREEPQYVGLIGYVAIFSDYELKQTDESLNGAWTVPTYEKDKQFWNEIGLIEHKTEVLVKEQELEHDGWGRYSGYLLVERLDNQEQLYINVSHFVTKPYWTYEDKVEAVLVGEYIAEYKQVSNYYPVDKSGDKVELDDGMKVLVIEKTDLYGDNGPDDDTNQVEAVVFKEWKYGYGGVAVFFNVDDLTIIY